MIKYLLTIVILSGCALIQQPESQYERDINKINANYNSALVKEDAPLIVDEMSTEEYKTEFVTKVCGKPRAKNKIENKECTQKFDETFNARLSETYRFADGEAVNRKCQAYPIECKDFKQFEIWARESHNENVEVMRRNQLNEYQLYRNYQLVEQSRAMSTTGAALINYSQQQNKTTNCESTPNVFGGYSTKCR